jgi:pimeloyl-ACP methyl ester carboxylesterase
MKRADDFHEVFQSDGRDLSGRYFDSDGTPSPKPGLLFVHGLHSDQSGYQRRAEVVSAALGAVCFTFDLSGHGESAGAGTLDEFTPRDHLLDVLAAYDKLTSHEQVDINRVGVCAASYGAYLTALLVSRRPVRRILLRAPGLYDDNDLDTPLSQRRASRADVNAPLLFEGLNDFGGEILILESEKDEYIPHSVIEAYLNASPRAHHEVIADATHVLKEPAWKEAFLKAIKNWFREL